jgi:hypothetical protein
MVSERLASKNLTYEMIESLSASLRVSLELFYFGALGVRGQFLCYPVPGFCYIKSRRLRAESQVGEHHVKYQQTAAQRLKVYMIMCDPTS